MAHFKEGIDFWECSCGLIIAIGRRCWQCGQTYADILQAKAKEVTTPRQKQEQKHRPPAKTGKFISSFLFKNEKK